MTDVSFWQLTVHGEFDMHYMIVALNGPKSADRHKTTCIYNTTCIEIWASNGIKKA
jgi:hypothetical protein